MHNIFISHSSKDELYVQELVRKLRKNGHKVRNLAIVSDEYNDFTRPSDITIKHLLAERIKRSSLFVVLVGEITHKSIWVDYEISQAIEDHKNKVCISISNKYVLPDLVIKYKFKIFNNLSWIT